MKEMFGKPFSDISDYTEDERIALIVGKVRKGQIVAVIVDDEPDKIERYKQKFIRHGLRITAEAPGPSDGVHTIQVSPQKN